MSRNGGEGQASSIFIRGADSDQTLVLIDGAPLNDPHNFPNMQLRKRKGTPWDGEWMGAFPWRRLDGPWAAFPGGPLIDEHWAGLHPAHVLTGFRSTAYGGLVDAGMVVGWLHHAAAFVKRSFLGRAWLTVTTFDLTSEEAAVNPVAPHLLAAIVKRGDYPGFLSAPRRRGSPVEVGSIQIIVGWSGSWQAARPGNWSGRSLATKAALGG